MGYDTHFDGQIDIVPPLNLKEHNELKKFSETRHEEEDGTPGYWCQWVPTDDGDALVWDEDEKFYDSAEWMKYLIENFLGDKHTMNGVIKAMGEDHEDRWDLIVVDNKVFVQDYEFTATSEREV